MPYPSSENAYPSGYRFYPGDTSVQATTPETMPSARWTPPPATTPAFYSFLIGPASGGFTRELTDCSNRRVSFKLRDNAEANVEIDGASIAAGEIMELATDLHVFRSRELGGPKAHLFRGRIGATTDTLGDAGHRLALPALDYRAVLSRRVLAHGSQQTWTAQDVAKIAAGLVQQTQNKVGGDLRIVPRIGAAGIGTTTDRTFALGDQIGDKLKELAGSEQGFDYDISPINASELALDIWRERGTDKGVILQWPSPLVELTRTIDPSNYANAIRVTGQAPEGGGAEPAIQERTAADLATRPEGRWDVASGQQITTTKALEERADWLLANNGVIQPAYTAKLETGFWDGPDHIWLGDPVRLIVYSGRLRVDTVLRVQEITIDIDENETEQVSMTFGAAKPDYRKKATELERRLSDLERR